MKIRKRMALAAAFVAVAASACTSNSEEGGGETPSTADAKSASDFSRTVDLGDGYRLSLDSPVGVRIIEVPKKAGGEDPFVSMFSREGYDFSDTSSETLTELKRDPKWEHEVTGLIAVQTSCFDFDTFRNREDTVDATSPLNGQPVSYLSMANLDELKGKDLGKGITAANVRGSTYMLKLNDSPCSALAVVTTWVKGAPASPLNDLGYSVLVEGNGALTGPA